MSHRKPGNKRLRRLGRIRINQAALKVRAPDEILAVAWEDFRVLRGHPNVEYQKIAARRLQAFAFVLGLATGEEKTAEEHQRAADRLDVLTQDWYLRTRRAEDERKQGGAS